MHPNPTDWASLYIGKPWLSGGRGPTSFDCWGLVWWVYQHHFGISLPCYPGLNADDKRIPIRLFSNAISQIDQGVLQDDPVLAAWKLTTTPSEGSGVVMGSNGYFAHVGIFTTMDGGLIIHSAENIGVVASTLREIQSKGMPTILFLNPTF